MTAVAIFVKTPGLSPIKTRLASTVGKAAAESWHIQSAQAVAEVAQLANIGPVYWAVAETEGLNSPHWSGCDVIAQPSGGLGQRMADIHSRLTKKYASCVLLGADTPQIEPNELISAHTWLTTSQKRQLIGPASDGGFWMYGANHTPEPERWDRVHYSLPSTRDQFITAMGKQGPWLHLNEKTDVDTLGDIAIAREALRALTQPTSRQGALLAWLDQQDW